MTNESDENSKGLIVLGMYLHCQGCVDDVVKCLKGFDGVEQIETNANEHKITVKGEKADPKRVWDRVKKKMGKNVTLISPILKEAIKDEPEAKEDPMVVEVVIKVNLHCEGCARDVKYTIHQMKGVYTVETDMLSGEVTVKGVFEPQKLMEHVKKKTGKHVGMVKQTLILTTDKKDEEIENENKDQKEEEEEKENLCIINYHFYGPVLFSDENPNACALM